MSTKQFTLRMPVDLFSRISKKANRTAFILEAVREKVERDEQREVEASLLCLAGDGEANDISDFAESQAKVLTNAD